MQTSDKKHSGIGASSCERWWNCPGSVALSMGVKGNNSYAAAEGTVAHGLCEVALKQGIGQAAKLLGEVIMQDGHEIEVNEEMLEAAEIYVEAINDALFELKADRSCLYVEVPIQISSEGFGTCDAVIIKPDEVIHVFDFKYGKKAVEATQNKQMMYYALGAYLGLKEGRSIGRFIVSIVQPRAEHYEGYIRSYEFGLEELRSFKAELDKKIAETRKPNAETVLGNWCGYCPAGYSGKCSAQKARALEVMQADFADSAVLAKPETLDKEAILMVLKHGEEVIDWIKSVMDFATTRVREGEVFEGFKLVRKRANRKWIDTEEVEAVFSELGDDMYTKKLKSPNQIEKTLGKKNPKVKMVESLCIVPEGGVILVSEFDKREAVGQLSSAANDFTKID